MTSLGGLVKLPTKHLTSYLHIFESCRGPFTILFPYTGFVAYEPLLQTRSCDIDR